nr:hypothetical protein [Tanacetum cinerariifolium]
MSVNIELLSIKPPVRDAIFCTYVIESVHTGGASIPSGAARVPTGSFVSFLLVATSYSSPKLGPSSIHATIDKTPYTINEDLVRSRLKLADDGGIANLPIAGIYYGMDNIAFLQAILGIETRIKRQYKVLMFSSKLFANMRLNFEGNPMPLLPAMLLQAQAGDGAETAAGTFTNVEDEPLGGSFHMSPPRSTQAPLAGQPSGGAEDPITLTTLSFVVSTLVQKVNTLETELKAHNNLFKDVVGKLVKKVKAIEVNLKTKKRKMVVSDSDQEKGGKQDVDLDALRALANAAVTVDSNLSPDGDSTNPAAVPPGSSAVLDGTSTVSTGASTVPTGSLSAPVDVPSSVTPVSVSSKGKSTMVEEDIPVKARTFKQMKEEDNFPAKMAALIKRKRQASAEKLAQERQNRPITQAQQQAYMRQYVKNPSSVVYTTGWTVAYVKSYTDDQLKEEFEKIHKVVSSEESDNEAPLVWSALILHMVDRHDLVKLYGCVVQYYETHPIVGAGLLLWGDLQLLFDSHEGEIDSDVVGNDMTTAEKLIQFIKNQLAASQSVDGSRFPKVIQCCWFEFKYADAAFYKNIMLIYADFSSILVKTQSSRYVVPTGRVVVPTGRH